MVKNDIEIEKTTNAGDNEGTGEFGKAYEAALNKSDKLTADIIKALAGVRSKLGELKDQANIMNQVGYTRVPSNRGYTARDETVDLIKEHDQGLQLPADPVITHIDEAMKIIYVANHAKQHSDELPAIYRVR